MAQPAAEAAAGADGQTSSPSVTCGNCGNIVAQVRRCSVCTKATYCSQECQKEDWKFHKRICKKPPEEKPPAEKPPVDMEEMKKQMDELTKDKDPAFAAQMKQMMAGMMGVEVPKEPEKPPEVPCQNCSKVCEKPMRCGTCKAVSYCSAQCQKDDWRFHKRICAKPAAVAPPPEFAAAKATPSSSSSAPPRPKQGDERVVESEDVGTWYKHREWKPAEERQEFVPPKVAEAGAAAEAPAPIAQATEGAKKAGSAWNAAGTWEEKSMMPWWQERLEKLKGWEDGDDVLRIDEVSAPRGEASIVHVRGQPKFMYDITFEFVFSGLQRCKACSKSSPGCRCSNCMRVLGNVSVTDLCWDSEGAVSLRVQAKEPSGPSHVKKADQKECTALAEEKLLPAVRKFLEEVVAEYKAQATAEGPRWASQLPPVEKWEGAPKSAPTPLT